MDVVERAAEVEAREFEKTVAKAVGHPMRVAAYLELCENVRSPNQLTGLLGERLGSVSYHVRVLVELNLLDLVRTEPRRGAVEHFYRARTTSRVKAERELIAEVRLRAGDGQLLADLAVTLRQTLTLLGANNMPNYRTAAEVLHRYDERFPSDAQAAA